MDKTAAILEAIPPGYHVPGILFSTKTAYNIPGPGTTDWFHRMFIHPNGNIGIGTTDPTAKLSVQGGNTSTAISDLGTTLTASFNTANPQVTLGIGYVSSDNPFIQAYNNGTNSIRSLILNPFGGRIGIGTTNPQEELSVNGTIRSKEIMVETANWPDYVFKRGYDLLSPAEIKIYIDQNQHLPGMPSEQEVVKNGINLGEMVKLQTKKIEELTLYLIQQNNENIHQRQINLTQQVQIDDLKKQLTELLKRNK